MRGLLAPTLRLNLLSMNVLDQEGAMCLALKGMWKLEQGKLINTLYRTHLSVESSVLATAVSETPLDVWHKRMGHLGESGMENMMNHKSISQEGLGISHSHKGKDQALDKFQVFHKMVERETSRKFQLLLTTNGGEYTSDEFRDYCNALGIR
ncbi:hypothetical protein M569_00110 [Genlisea aurea]|uniref:GAG-pre-integrase domain-containing protein n=1 Tax=Genlisea aurea TaxID=192259 RepID=S8DAU0_9LAMI|nr:hypothetical protein M569_00110 [Genlisea aurea]